MIHPRPPGLGAQISAIARRNNVRFNPHYLARPSSQTSRWVHRDQNEEQGPIADGPQARDRPLAILEAALLMSTEPLTARKLGRIAGLKDGREARRHVRRLQSLYEADESSFQIEEVADGYQLLTRPQFHSWLMRILHSGRHGRLSRAARETLAIVAYRQPIVRADIEAVRGVQCGEILRQLMDRGLIRIAGKDSSLGRPVLYGTTRKFLQAFGLKNLKDLPAVEALVQTTQSVVDENPEDNPSDEE